MEEPTIVFNGIDGATGDYLLPPLSPQSLSTLAQSKPLDDPQQLRLLKARFQRETEADLAPMAGVDPDDLAQAGWAVVFAANTDPAIREALRELLDFRKSQASTIAERRYQEFTGHRGARPEDTASAWLSRHGAGGGAAVDPNKMPYYLLLVGSPEEISFKFQYGLDVQHAVGRIHFDSLEDYARYARSVVAAERGELSVERRLTLFGVMNSHDAATKLSATALVRPLADKLAQPGWTVQSLVKDQATKAALAELVGGSAMPAVLFTASHGMGFPVGDPCQLAHQGALLCQDWPGPANWRQRIPQDFYFAGDDVCDDARVAGLIAFHFACYGGGTPRLDDFAHRSLGERAAIAPHAFVARLPQRLLAHPRGGALAVIGHVDRAWGYSFRWYEGARASDHVQDFQSALMRLMAGQRVGWAMEFFNSRYANLSSMLTSELEDIKFNKIPDDVELSGMWTAHNDARGYAVIGDPAVRLPLAAEGSTPLERPVVQGMPASTTSTPVRPAGADGAGDASRPDTATITPVVPDEHAPMPPAGDTTEFGVVDTLRDARAALRSAVEQFMARLGTALTNAGTLEVTTYALDEHAGQSSDTSRSQGRLRAMTRITLGGDIETYVPEAGTAIDQNLWRLHCDMVAQAQANRNEMVRLALAALGDMINPPMP